VSDSRIQSRRPAAACRPALAYWASIVVEAGGGALLLVGLQTRFATIVLAVFTLIAATFFHRNFGDQNQMIHFMKNLAMAGGLLQVVAFGAGSFSIDARRVTK
jgi:putative oxidoreductase